MPAYRSEAEAEIRTAVVARLRQIMPGCRIIHEINACSFGNRIDVLAVGEDDLAAVEIKSEKDKLDRLPSQLKAMRSVSNKVFAAIHEKFLHTHDNGWVFPPNEARGATIWAYPKAKREGDVECSDYWYDKLRFAKPKKCLPPDAIFMLWRNELQNACRTIGLKGVSKLTMEEAVDRLRWSLTGAHLDSIICETLRRRECVEADPPILSRSRLAA